MKNKAKLILASAVFVAALMLLVPLAQTDMSGGGGIGNSDSDPIVLSANGTSVSEVSSLAGLQSALETAKNSDNTDIKLTKAISITKMNTSLFIPDGVTLDLNGFTLSIPTIGSDNSNRIAIEDNANVTIKNGKITYSGADGSKSPIVVGKSKTAASTAQTQTLTLTNVNISSNGYGVAIFAKGNLTVNDGSITAVNSAISTNGGDPEKDTTNSCDAVVNLNGGQYVSTSTAAIFFPGGKTLNINSTSQSNSIFFGKTGFDIRSGTVTINNATIYVTGDSNEKKTDNTGPTPWGMGIAIFDNGAYGKNTNENSQITQTPISVTYNNTSIVNAQYDYSIIGFTNYGNIKNDDGSLKATLPTFTASHQITLTSGSNTQTISKDTPDNRATLAESKPTVDHPITIETINGNNFIFANGQEIIIFASGDNSKIEYKNNEDATILFVDNFDLSTFTVFGGKNNDNSSISTNITMNGGKVLGIAGGGYGAANVTASNVTVTSGTATYVTGGGWSTDKASDVSNKNNMTNKTTATNVTISGGEVKYALGGGRLGYAHVETANLTINGGTFDEIIAGGMNGYTGTANLTINSTSKVTANLVASGNRGEVSNANVKIQSIGTGEIKYVAIGALKGTTSTDGGPNAMFDKISFEISKDVTISGNIYLGGSKWMKNDSPSTNPWDSVRTDALGETDITINAEGCTIIAGDVTSDVGSGAEAVGSYVEYTIGTGKMWTFNGCTLDISIGDSSSITNNGTIKYIGKEGDAAVTNGLKINGYGGNVIVDNINFEGGFGLYVHDAVDVTVTNCEFKNMNAKTSAASGELVNAIRIEKCTGNVTIGGVNSANKITDIHPDDLPMFGAGIYVNNCGDSDKTLNVSYNEITNVAYNALQLTGLKFSTVNVNYNEVTEWDYDNDESAANVGKGRAIRMSVSDDVKSEPSINISNNIFVKKYDVNKEYDSKNILKATKGYSGALTSSPTFSDNTVNLTYEAESTISNGFVIKASDAFGIENVNITFDGVNFTTKGLYIENAGNVTIKGCTFTNISESPTTDSSAPHYANAISLVNCNGTIIIGGDALTDGNTISGKVSDSAPGHVRGIYIYNCNASDKDLTIKNNSISNTDYNAVQLSGVNYKSITISNNTISNWDADNDSVSSGQDDEYAAGRAIRISFTSVSDISVTISENKFLKEYGKISFSENVKEVAGYDDGNIIKINLPASYTFTFEENVISKSMSDLASDNNLFKIIDSDKNTIDTIHTVLFKPNGGKFTGYNTDESMVYLLSSEDNIQSVDMPSASKSSNSFEGWFSENNTSYTEVSSLSADLILTAKWTYTGGSGIPVTPPTDDPEPKPIIPDENNNVTVPPIDEKKADELIHEAVSSGSDSISIIDTNNVDGKYTEVTVSKSDLETISKKIENNNNINSVSIETSEGDIIIEKEVLNSILETTDADSISFEIEDAKDKLTEEQKEAIGDRPVYDINIKAGNENITSFNGKTITISLPYTLKAGEDPENIVVYYVKEDGSLEKMNCTYKDGKVIFETDHLSKYVIGYEESDKPVTPDTPDNKKDDNNTIYYAVAAVIVILIIIALAYYFMKKKQ